MKLKNIGLAAASLFFVVAFCLNAYANLDPSFGNIGKVISSPDGSQFTGGFDYALLPDGKIIAVGGGASLGFIVARYNPNGSLDTGFGTNGWSSTTFGDSEGGAVAVEIQTDGKIVVGGTIRKLFNGFWVYDFAVVRLNPNGSPDPTFDGDGIATFSFVPEIFTNPNTQETFSSLKIAPDGKIIVGGSAGISGPSGNSRFIFARLNADGALDSTFDGDGKLVGVAGNMSLNDMTVLPDGSVVAVGSGVNGLLRIAYKYSTDGSLVWTYSRNDNSSSGGGLYGIAAQPDGKLIVVGRRTGRIAAIRLNAADGTEDASFAAPPTQFGSALSVAVQTDGKIIANFYTSTNSNSFNIVRFNADGTLDLSFGAGGYFLTGVSNGGEDYGYKILVQPDGKIVVGGYSAFSFNPRRYYFSILRVAGERTAFSRSYFDYDGDEKADVSVYRPSTGYWYISQSSNGAFAYSAFGLATDAVVPADYDGDRKTDIAVRRNNNWYIIRSRTNTFYAPQFGQTSDIAVPGDFDSDNSADIAVFRNGTWIYLSSRTGSTLSVTYGAAGDKPVAGDYDADGIIDYAIYRPSSATWFIRRSSNGETSQSIFGLPDDNPVAADYDGDGKTDIAVYRPSAGDWYYLKSSNGEFYGEHFGINGDKPVPADYDGDGKTDVAVFRPSDGTWYINQSTAGFKAVNWGISTDIPTPNVYIR